MVRRVMHVGVWLVAWLALPAMAATPARIMSLNLCADQLVLALVPPERIASVTYLARDCRISVACEAAKRVPVNHGSAEEMVAAKADLLVSGRFTTRATVAIARRFGFHVLDLEVPSTIEGVRTQMLDVADAVGEPQAGAALVAAFDRDLAALPAWPAGAQRPVAAVYETSGFTVGKGSLIDTLLARAGFDNLATRLDIDNYPHLSLEQLIASQPDLLLVESRGDAWPSLGSALLDHPVLKQGFAADRQIPIPQRLWICGGPSIIDALQRLIQARRRIEARP